METCYSDTPKTEGKPFVKRIGDNRLERNNAGNVSMCFGYYSANQQAARKLYCDTLSTALTEILERR